MPRILIVDNTAVIREPIAAVLESRGYETVVANGVAEAARVLRDSHVDLIILELALPRANGFQLLRAMTTQSSRPCPPTMVLTSCADRSLIIQAARLGVRDYLLKSQFSLEGFLNRVESALAGDSSRMAQPLDGSAQTGATEQSDESDDVFAVSDMDEGGNGTASVVEQPETMDEAAEQLKSLRPILNRSEINDRLDGCNEMKALSPVVAELLRLTSSESASVDQIVKVIKRDQAIALKLLKVANSAVYTRGDPVDSLDQAVMRIGMGSIRQTVMNMAVIDNFGTDREFSGIDPMQFWEHSIACGLIGAEIARARMDKQPDIAFTMGLLHDVGRLVYIDRFTEEYKEVFRVARTLQLPLERVESKLLLLNHADCMDRLLHLWKFPKSLIDPIVFHHLSIGNMRRMASRRVEEVATLGLANRLTHAMLLGDSGNDVIYATEGLCRHLRVSEKVIAHIEETIRDQTREIKYAMLAESNQGGWKDRAELWRERLGCSLRPLYISMEPELDAFRIFFSQLTDRIDEAPNLVVLHVADPREVSTLVGKIDRMESERNVRHLPLLVLTPSRDLALPESVTEPRQHEVLCTPVTVPRLVEATRRLLGLDDQMDMAA